MNKHLPLLVSILLGIAVFAPCASENNVGIDKSAVTPAAQELLEHLKQELEMVRAAVEENAHYSLEEVFDVAALVGLTKRKIRADLGEPRLCDREDGLLCAEVGDWNYSFYHVLGFGGGPELVLKFRNDVVCAEAIWVLTQ